MFEQVQSQKFYLQIVNQVRQLITEGKLKVGDRLPPERTLAQEFGASRACIREALSALEILGLIECKSGQGNFVKADRMDALAEGQGMQELMRSHSPYEIFEARMEIEPSMAALAAQHATEEDLARLAQHLAGLNALGREVMRDQTKADGYMEEDRQFHLEIARAAHNNVLLTVSTTVNRMMRKKHWRGVKRRSIEREGNLHRFELAHQAIYEAIRDRDAERARMEIRKHIQHIEEDLFDGEERT